MSYKLKILVVSLLAAPILYSSNAAALDLKETTSPLRTTISTSLLKQESTTSPFTTKVVKKEDKKAEPVKSEPETPKVVTYTVEEGDSLSTIAERHNTNWLRLWQKNTQLQNQDVLAVGDVITIPDASEELSERASVSSPEPAQGVPAQKMGSYPSQPIISGEPNGYVWGNCTWYVKNRKPNIGGYWGNAGAGWLYQAARYGFQTSNTPVAGSIGVQGGHVVIIESVNGDGTVNLSEMNYNGGVGIVHYDRRPISSFIGFIYA